MKETMIVDCRWYFWKGPQSSEQESKGIGNQKNPDHPDHSNVRIS